MKENKLHQTIASEQDILATTITTASSSYTAPRSTQKQESQATAPPLPSPSKEDIPVPSYYDQSKIVTNEEQQKKVVQTQNPEQFNLLASALFTSSSNPNDIDHDPFAPTSQSKSEEEVLRLPNRSVTVAKNKKDKAGVTFTEQQPEILRAAPNATGTWISYFHLIFLGSPKHDAPTAYEEVEEEDEETILPRMTEAEKAVWKAKQEDLTRRRKGRFFLIAFTLSRFSWGLYLCL